MKPNVPYFAGERANPVCFAPASGILVLHRRPPRQANVVILLFPYSHRRASSASSARRRRSSTKPSDLPLTVCPIKRPSAVKPRTAATAPLFLVDVGRIIATGPKLGFRKCVGSGIIRLACKVSPFRDSGFVSPCAL